MNTNLTKYIKIVSRYSLLIFFTHLVTAVALMGYDGNSQGLDDVYVSINWDQLAIKESFQDLERQTGFRFFYKKQDLRKVSKITLAADQMSLKDVLTTLSQQKGLKFKRLNEVISVTVPAARVQKQAALAREQDDVTVSGKVTEENGVGIPGVTIQVKGTNLGVISDVDGHYKINVPAGSKTLVFSSIGFELQEIAVGSQTVIHVTMVQDLTKLEEVLVVGYGTMKKREVAGSISSVKFDDVENTPMQSFDKVLQGRAPGVQIVNGGAPGGATQVLVRGLGTISSGAQPLFIVDGMQVAQGALGEAGGGQENVLAALNPNDIVSVEVLKDASASIYGAQAANGVILITTKRGRQGKTQFDFNAHWGVNEVINELDLLTGPEWTELVLEGYANRYGIESDEYRAQLSNLGNPADAPTYDWQKLLFQKGLVQNYQLSARGGNENSTFYLSGSYNNTEGHVIGTGFQRGTFRANLNNNFSKKIKGELTANLSYTNTDATRGDGFWFNNPTIASAFIVPTNAPYNEDGSIREPLSGLYSENPLVNEHSDLFDETTTNYRVLTRYQLSYEILKGLVFKSSWNIDFLSNYYNYYASADAQVGASTEGEVYQSNNRSLNWQTDQVLTYSRSFGDHQLDLLGGVNYRQQKFNYFYASGEMLSSSKLTAVGTAATPEIGGQLTEWKLAGMFSRAHYIYQDKYILSATIRRDGSSRFGRNHRWGVFPAMSVAWRVGNESFMSAIDQVVSDLKVRASVGVTGNSELGNYASRGFFDATGSFLGAGTLTPSTVENDRLAWEESQTFDVGVDAYFLKSRIAVTADYFVRNTKELLLERPLPTTSGYGTVWENVGELQNRGLELEINSVNVSARDFKWETSFNITMIENEVQSLYGASSQIIQDDGSIIKEGESAFSWYAIRYAGVNPADGRPMYLDQEGELTFHPTDNDRVVIGSSLPTYYGGITNSFSYKGLKLSVFFQYSGGNYLRNNLAFSTKASGGFVDRNQQRSELDRWQKPGDITDVPIAWTGFTYDARPGNNYSSRHIEKGDYVRLKQVNLSYAFPKSLLSKIRLRSLVLYASGNNLWTQTDFSGRDPELLNASATGDYPQGKGYVFGINLGF